MLLFRFPILWKDFFFLIRNFQTDIQRISHPLKPVEVTDDEKKFSN
jgi:hypothetical protein